MILRIVKTGTQIFLSFLSFIQLIIFTILEALYAAITITIQVTAMYILMLTLYYTYIDYTEASNLI
jgi:uncharacterized membrane protein